MEVNMVTFLGFGLLVLMTILILVVKKQFDEVKVCIYSLFQSTVDRIDDIESLTYTASITFVLIEKPSALFPDVVVEHPSIKIEYVDDVTQDAVISTLSWDDGLAKISQYLQYNSNYCDPQQLVTLITKYSTWLQQPVN